MPTQVPPSRLDSTKDFSSLVPSAFAKANAAFDAANTASGAAATSTPKISSIVYPGNDTAAATTGGQTVTLNGAGFNAGASVLINGSYAGVVSVANSTSLSFTTPSNSGGTYILYVINTDGGTGISVPGISYSGTPSWSNAAGSLATVYETAAVNTQLTATGDISDGTITYSLQSGTLPPGSSLNSSTGLLSGTTQVTENSTTYNFTIRATDGQNQDTDRAFSITISPDVVTWSSPADGTVTALFQNEAMSNVTLSATSAAGQSVSYTANALPTGVTISGSNVTGTPTVLGNTISVITATAANTNRTATRTFTWVVSVANDTYFKNTTLLLNGETTVTPFINDASANNFALTIAGNTKPVLFNPYTPGYYSNYFDGTGDFLSTPANAAFSYGTGDYTIETWIYLLSYTGSGVYGYICGAGASGQQDQFVMNPTTGTFYHYDGGATYPTSSTAIPLNTWTHIAACRSSGTLRLFMNGALVGSGASSTNITIGATNTFYIGNRSGGGDSPQQTFNGYLSNLRVVKGTGLYTSAFTPSTTPLTSVANTSLLTCQSNRLMDNSPRNAAITKGGDVSVSSAIPFAANSSYSTYGSTYFDGTGDVLTLASGQFPVLGTNNFTMEAWVYTTSVAAGTGGIFDMWNGGTSAFLLRRSSTSLQIYVQGSQTIDSGAILNVNTWFHVAVVRNGTTITLYVNGLSVGTPITSYSTSITGNVALGIGGTATTGNEGWIGYITDARIVNGTAVYTANFTPPTSPLTAIANTSLLTCQYNGGATNQGIIDNSNFNNIITRNGNTSQGTFSPYSVTGWSNFFDGTGDYLSAGSNSSFAVGTGDFTFQVWVYPTAYTSPVAAIFDTGSGVASGRFSVVLYSSGLVYVDNNANLLISSSTLPLNAWTLISIIRSSGTMTMYFNGTSVASGSIANNFTETQSYIGRTVDGYYFQGYISNLRLVKGTALANTVPTTPLTAITNTSLLTCQSNRLIDNSPNSFAITKNGDTSVQAFGPFGSVPEAVPISYSNYFDGTGDQLITTTSANLALQSNDFTVELWYYPTGKVQSYPVLISNGNFGSNKWQINDRHQAFPTKVSVNLYAGSSGDGWLVSTTTISVNTWYHVALVRSGSTFTLYINGIAEQSKTLSGSITAATDFITLGQDQNQGVTCYTGYISNARIVKGTAVYTSNFTPSTTPLTAIANTSLLTCQSTTMIDNSTNRFTITANGNVTPRIFNPFGYTAQSATSYTPSVHGGSIYLDGTGDYLTTAVTNSAFNLSTGNWTIEAWVYPTTLSGSPGVLNLYATDGSNSGLNFWINSSGVLNQDNGVTGTTGAGTILINTWTHIAAVRTSGATQLYVNGVAVGATISQAPNAAGFAYIGRMASTPQYFTGYIADVRVIKGFALYTSNFVPPAQALNNYSTTNPASLLLNFNNGGIIDQHGTNVLETVGNTQLSTAVKKYGSASMYFDGTGDLLSTRLNTNLVLNSDFTIEAWVYPTTITGSSRTVYFLENGVNGSTFYITSAGILSLDIANVATYTLGSATVSINSWQHIVFVRSGTTLTGYINGVSSGTATVSASLGSSGVALVGANSNVGGAPFAGYIDDLRITKGVARYTTTFTPPSALITK